MVALLPACRGSTEPNRDCPIVNGSQVCAPSFAAIFHAVHTQQEVARMHYKNGREAKNGDKVVLVPEYAGSSPVIGILYNATAGNDYCNGKIAPISPSDPSPNLKECLHLDDVLAALPADVPNTAQG
jgi:hypothetical protein